MEVVRTERRLQWKRERRAACQSFIKDAYEFAKGLFTESKRGKLECTKEELQEHLKMM